MIGGLDFVMRSKVSMDSAKDKEDKCKVLLVVDLQPEFADTDGEYERILKFVRSNPGFDLVIGTKCLNPDGGPWDRYTDWVDCKDGGKPLEYAPDILMTKVGYGLDDYSRLDRDCEYYVMGYNTDACVLKIATDLFDRNFDFKVLIDYCYSSEGAETHKRGKEVLRDLMPKAILKGDIAFKMSDTLNSE